MSNQKQILLKVLNNLIVPKKTKSKTRQLLLDDQLVLYPDQLITKTEDRLLTRASDSFDNHLSYWSMTQNIIAIIDSSNRICGPVMYSAGERGADSPAKAFDRTAGRLSGLEQALEH